MLEPRRHGLLSWQPIVVLATALFGSVTTWALAAPPEEPPATQTETQKPEAPPAPPKMKTTVTVTAQPGPLLTELSPDVRTLPASASVLGTTALEQAVQREAGEVLRSLPGVDFVYYGQGGIPSGPSVRGYTDRNFGQDIAGFLDGIPLNIFGFVASHGALDLTPLATGTIQHVELVRGPLDARYGDFHRGASVNFVTRDGIPRPELSVAAGSYGSFRAGGTFGNYLPDRKVSVFLSAEGQTTNGYADNQQVKYFKGLGKVYAPFGRSDLTFTAQGYWADWEAPSYLDLALLKGGNLDDKAAVNLTDGGDQDNQLLYVRYRRDPGPHQLAVTVHGGHRKWRRWRSDFLLGPTQLQTAQLDDRTLWGFRAEKTFGHNLFGRPSMFLVGTALQRDDAETRIDATRERTVVRPTDNVDELLTSFGAYVQEQWSIADRVKLLLGLRYSHVDYDLHDNIRAPGTYVSAYSDSQVSPKFGLAASPVRNVVLYANLATGMRSPTPRTEVRNSLGSVGRVEIADTKSYELGLNLRLFSRLDLHLDVWRADNSNEIRGIPPGGTQFESLGKSRRDGFAVEANWFPGSGTRIFAGVSFVDAELRTPTTPAANHLPDIPDYVHNLGFESQVGLTGSLRGRLALIGDFSFYGPRDLNTLGTLRSERYTRATAKLVYHSPRHYRAWLGGFAYPTSRFGESAFLFGTRVGVRANPRFSVEAGVSYTF